MFNYHNRQYIFRQSSGELWNFFSDLRQNLCYNMLTRQSIWSNAVVLHKNVYQYFYMDMDQEDIFHLLYQDNDGNIHYSRLDGQSIKTVPVLNSKTPLVYDKQLYIAPFKNNLHFFYVLQHENSFILAYQVLSNGKMSSPKVVDYVSGSSLPCSILYDKAQNIYAFYQSYDGKFLQLGYKKYTLSQKHWSDFTPVTKYSGNCEYPHAIIDNNGVIHLCYQRRSPKFFEMVYQQKAPDKNLWTTEAIAHSSVHSFENASILQVNGNIVVYWVREEAIYYNTCTLTGNSWGKPSRLDFSSGRQLQCICSKSNSPRDRLGDSFQLSPEIYPGSLSNGLKLAFNTGGSIGDNSQLIAGSRERDSASGGDIKSLVLDTFKQIQSSIDEVREGWSAAKDELFKLTNAYGQLNRELEKYSIRLNMLESQLGQAKKLSSRQDAINTEIRETKGFKEPQETRETKDHKEASKAKDIGDTKPANIASQSLEPDKLKEWIEWKEPKEWQES